MRTTEKHPRPSSASTESFGPLGRRAAHALMAGASLLAALMLLAAPSAASAAGCPNEAIREEQGMTYLPACMALEQVSPSQKLNQSALAPEVSSNGNRIRFSLRAAVAETTGLVGLISGADVYVATRTEAGWETLPTAPPAGVTRGWNAGEYMSRGFDPELSRWFQIGATTTPQGYETGVAQVYRGVLGTTPTPFSPLLVPIDGASHTVTNVVNAQMQATSMDGSHFYFAPGDASATYLPGDPTPVGPDENVYIAQLSPNGLPSLALLAREGSRVWGGSCGVRIGGFEGRGGTANGRNQGAVSSDGSRVYFSTRPGQSETGACSLANKLRIMERVEGAGGPHVSELFSSECTRLAPPCDTGAEGDDHYEGASADGTKVYFSTNRQLANSDLDGSTAECSNSVAVAGCDLYLYDSTRPSGHQLIQVSAGENVPGLHEVGEDADVYSGTVAISGDGSHVYFVAQGVLTTSASPGGGTPILGQPNLYVWNATTEALAFIGTLDPGDAGRLWGGRGTFKNRAYPVPATGQGPHGEDFGGDGRILVFQTEAGLTPNDTDGGRLDIYRYDSSQANLSCISCAPGMGGDSEPFDVATREASRADLVGADFAEFGRWVSDDGQTVVFKTPEGLIPSDTNGVTDSYLWKDGRLAVLPGTGDPEAGMTCLSCKPLDDVPVMSPNGSTVAFQSALPLLPQDGDTAVDIYAARVDGGHPNATPTFVCQPGASCQGAPSPGPADTAPGTSSFSGPGNSKPKHKAHRKARKKHKHSHRRHKHSHRRHKQNRKRNRDNTHKQGGRK